MRLIALIVGGVAVGAVSGGVLQTFVTRNSQMLAAVRALGGEAASMKIGDINPLKAYEYVKQQISSGDIGRSLNLRTSTQVPTVSGFSLGNLGAEGGLHIDNAQVQRGWAASIGGQVRDSNRRMEEMAAYARNPSAWRGLPPH
ncbi:MAG TPA: hypothetical protein VKW08_08325 [Xanthobacteraceae bacterium]|nr:hypothetical protein [Xanthobacteraceae bacterium]